MLSPLQYLQGIKTMVMHFNFSRAFSGGHGTTNDLKVTQGTNDNARQISKPVDANEICCPPEHFMATPSSWSTVWNASTISWCPQTLWFSCRNGLNEVQLVVTLSRSSYAWVFWPSKVCQRIILTGCIICLIPLVTSRFQKYSMSTWTHGPYFKLLILSNLSQPQKKTGISRNCTRKSRTLEGKWALASRSLCSNLSKWRGKVPNAGTPTKASCLVLHHCPPPEASRIQGFRSHDIIFNHLLNAFLQLELLIVLFINN